MNADFQTDNYDGLKISIIRNREMLTAILDDWQKLQDSEGNPVPVVDPSHYIYELESMGTKASPYIICLHRGSCLETMLIGRFERIRMPMRVGYLTLMNVRIKHVHIFQGGLLGKKNDKNCFRLLKALRESLNDCHADMAALDHPECSSSFYNFVLKSVPFLALNRSPRIDGHWIMEIPENIEEFFARKSSKKRKTLRWTIRKLQKSFNVCVKKYSDEDCLEKGISDAACISLKTYQHALEGGFNDNPQMRNYLKMAAKKGLLRLYILYIDDRPAAFEWGILYRNTFFLKTIGFDPDWRGWSVGTVLFLKVLEDLCSEKNVKRMDFGFGDAEYKKIYGVKRTDTRSLFVYADRFIPRLISLLHSVSIKSWSAGAYLANKVGLERKIKRIWRDFLRRRQSLETRPKSNNKARILDESV